MSMNMHILKSVWIKDFWYKWYFTRAHFHVSKGSKFSKVSNYNFVQQVNLRDNDIYKSAEVYAIRMESIIDVLSAIRIILYASIDLSWKFC